jgi:putative membrane protein
MADEQNEAHPQRFVVHATADSHFSWLRTRFSIERTLMAWVRTAVALIGFGFTIVQFFERLSSMEGVAPALRPHAPRVIGLSLIAAGVVSLMISAWQYHSLLTYLWRADFKPIAGARESPVRTPLFVVAIGLAVIGIFAFVTVFFRAL